MSSNCKHCHDAIPANRLAQGDDFCCHGCSIAFRLIQDHNSDQFYQLCDLSAEHANTAIDDTSFCADYNSTAFQNHYVRVLDNGLHAITWYVQGAHCAACVWLLERLQQFDAGVKSCRVHIGKQQLISVHDPALSSAKDIAETVAQLGYRLYPWQSDAHQQAAVQDQRNLFVRFAIACGSMAGCMHVSWNILAGEYTLDLDQASRDLFALMAALLALPAITYCSWPWYRSAWQSLKHKLFNIDVSVSSIIILGSIISFTHLALGRSDLYFDAMTMFVCFLLGGRVVLHLAKQRVGTQQDALKHVLPLFVHKHNGAELETISIDAITAGDVLAINAGQRLPVDAILNNEHAQIDNALLSGEELPLEKTRGDVLPAGAKIIDQDCTVTAQQRYHESSLATLLDHSRQQSADKGLAVSDRLLQWFTPLVSVLAIITWLCWAQDPARAWDQAIAVFIVACPCALGIAAPLVNAVFMRHAAERGILVSQAQHLEAWPSIQHIVFDKTGTLTEGRLQLEQIQVLDEQFAQSLPYMLAACKQSQHPIARAMLAHYHVQAEQAPTLDNAIALIPHGMAWQSPLGSMQLCRADDSTASTGFNHSQIRLNNQIIAHCSFHDDIRYELKALCEQLQQAGKQIHICSGDLQQNVERVATALNIPRTAAHGQHSPEDKRDFIQQLQQQGPVMMIGDGVNDALALDKADISIGVRGGLEAAMKHSDIYISNNVSHSLPSLWPLLHAHRQNLRSCLAVSLAYNVMGIAAAMLGWWGPLICAIAMPLSSLSVIALACLWRFPHAQSRSSKRTRKHAQARLSGAAS